MENVHDVLSARGFIKQTTTPDLRAVFDRPVTCYAGFDPTADSLHVGHMLPVMALAQLQRAGHRPIAIVGGATARIGDPSGKDAMRSMLTDEQLAKNLAGIRAQLGRILDFSAGKALLLNNGDWLNQQNYIDFLRDVGAHFSVNRMLTAECFKARLDKEAGLSFLEFNYMLLQAYDFLHLFRTEQCTMQLGGDDQWSNMLAGIDLIRRVTTKEACAFTLPLLTTASGGKMGKTEKGAVWLDAAKTPVNEFYQYWRNSDDRDVERFLKFFTFVPLDDIVRYSAWRDRDLNKAKSILAFRVTEMVHGRDAATAALAFERQQFGMPDADWEMLRRECGIDAAATAAAETLNVITVSAADLAAGKPLVKLLVEAGICASLGEGRRLIQQGGVRLNGAVVSDIACPLTAAAFAAGTAELMKGKKQKYTLRTQ